jgi:alpha-D-ribose 1-methylphosphonate 5-phosphate C-P lyase
VTEHTEEASLIQTRHRIPETPLTEGQILVYQVPIPEPLRFLEPRETETRKMHALEEYGLMHVKLYEDIAHNGEISTAYAYPVKVEGRYVMDPSPIPKFDNRARTADLCDPALYAGGEPRFRGLSVRGQQGRSPLRSLRLRDELSRRGDRRRCGRADVRLLGYGFLCHAAR